MRYDSDRMQRVQSPVIPIVGEWIASHPGTISLGQGVVYYGPPPEVTTAILAAADDPRVHRYGPVRGTDALVAAFADKLRSENGIKVDGRRALVTTAGSNMGFVNAVLAIADVDDEIILMSPYYFNHEMAVVLAGCRPIIVPTDRNYHLDLDAIESAMTSRTRAVVTVSPNNPTGAVYSRETLIALNQLCLSRGIYHIHDEAYEYFTYAGQTHYSPAAGDDTESHTISLYSLSKAYGMAGWRIGFMVVPSQLETAVKKIQDTNLVCPPMISQIAATAALSVGAGWCRTRIAEFQQVRDMIVTELGVLGDLCRVPVPEGAFYALLQLQTDRRDIDMVHALISKYGVAVMPGSTFGATDGCILRVAFGALDANTAKEGVGRLVRGLNGLLRGV